MKDNISYELRNRIVEEHLHCINTVIWQNWSLIQAARLERDDVYQQLAIRLIRCVDTYDPSKGPLKKRIYAQLKYELLNCKDFDCPAYARGATLAVHTGRTPMGGRGANG